MRKGDDEDLKAYTARRAFLLAIRALTRELRKMNQKNREIFDDDEED